MFDMTTAAASGLIVAISAAIVATLLTPPPSGDVTVQFDRVNTETGSRVTVNEALILVILIGPRIQFTTR